MSFWFRHHETIALSGLKGLCHPSVPRISRCPCKKLESNILAYSEFELAKLCTIMCITAMPD